MYGVAASDPRDIIRPTVVAASVGATADEISRLVDDLIAQLRAAGLLVQPGGTVETCWAILGEDAAGEYIEYAEDEADARRKLAIYAHDLPAHIAYQTVHTGPWQPATQAEGAPINPWED